MAKGRLKTVTIKVGYRLTLDYILMQLTLLSLIYLYLNYLIT